MQQGRNFVRLQKCLLFIAIGAIAMLIFIDTNLKVVRNCYLTREKKNFLVALTVAYYTFTNYITFIFHPGVRMCIFRYINGQTLVFETYWLFSKVLQKPFLSSIELCLNES